MNPGDSFGSLTYEGPSETKYKSWFRCACGTLKEIWTGNVTSGDTVSCGCVRKKTTADLRGTHHQSGTSLYQCWKDMKRRSTEGSAYHARRPTYVGVRRDPRWDDFEAFAADMADGYFPGAVLSRVGDQGDYTRANCRWLTKSENSKERFA